MLNVNLNKNANRNTTETETVQMENNEVGKQLESKAKTNVLTVHEQCCSCGKCQEYKYPCAHAMGCLRNGGICHSEEITESCLPMVLVQELASYL